MDSQEMKNKYQITTPFGSDILISSKTNYQTNANCSTKKKPNNESHLSSFFETDPFESDTESAQSFTIHVKLWRK